MYINKQTNIQYIYIYIGPQPQFHISSWGFLTDAISTDPIFGHFLISAGLRLWRRWMWGRTKFLWATWPQLWRSLADKTMRVEAPLEAFLYLYMYIFIDCLKRILLNLLHLLKPIALYSVSTSPIWISTHPSQLLSIFCHHSSRFICCSQHWWPERPRSLLHRAVPSVVQGILAIAEVVGMKKTPED